MRVSVSARVQAEGQRLTERGTLNMLHLPPAASNETSANPIGNGRLALLRNPGELGRMRKDPDLNLAAVDTLPRFDSPVQEEYWRLQDDREVNGFALRRRDNVVALLGAANRNPAVWNDPDRFDVRRSDDAHLSFRRGIHHCLGRSLTRLESRIAPGMLLERFASIRLLAERPGPAGRCCCAGPNRCPCAARGPEGSSAPRPASAGRLGRASEGQHEADQLPLPR